MTPADLVFLLALAAALAVTVPFLGRYIAFVYDTPPDQPGPGGRVFGPIERAIYRIGRIDPRREQRWTIYASSLLAFSAISVLALYGLQRLQGSLPLNPNDRAGVAPAGAWNTAVSFVTNTNWQWYAGESTMSHLTQMLGLAVQNFVSAAAGMAVAVAIIRGLSRKGGSTLGNFWVDLVRGTLRILLPLALVVGLVLVSEGVVQNFAGGTTVTTVEGSEQTIPGGPAASQIAIKQIGSNGGGFFNANSAHPLENPTGLSNFVQTWSILALPFAFAVAYGRLVGDRRQGRLVLGVMAALLLTVTTVAVFAEASGNPLLTDRGVDQASGAEQVGGNLEGKDVRFGPTLCGTWAAATTGTSNGSVNCLHDSFTPIGGLAPMAQMLLGEVSPGGVGVGLMGLLINALLAVFIAGLMVGRTPEYLGKKIQAAEMKLLTLYILAMPIVVLSLAAISVVKDSAVATIQDQGAHGLSEVLYNFASVGNNNGSAFAGMGTGTDWYTVTMAVAMMVGRFVLIIPALAIGGSLVRKQRIPETTGTLPTHTPLFGGLVVGVVLVVAGLTFFPALALGPIVEQLTL